MIVQFLKQLETLFNSEFNVLINPIATHVVLGKVNNPLDSQLPLIELFPGELVISPEASDTKISEPAPQKVKRWVEIEAPDSGGPYALNYTPTAGVAAGKLWFNKDLAGERSELILENTEFTINRAAKTLTFTIDVSAANFAEIDYEFAGNVTMRAFTQQFFIAVSEKDNLQKIEEISALACAMVFTNLQNLIADFNNSNAPVKYQTKVFSTKHLIQHLQFLGGNYNEISTTKILKFEVKGLMYFIKELEGGYEFIKYIISKGKTPTAPTDIDIDIGLG